MEEILAIKNYKQSLIVVEEESKPRFSYFGQRKAELASRALWFISPRETESYLHWKHFKPISYPETTIFSWLFGDETSVVFFNEMNNFIFFWFALIRGQGGRKVDF